MKAAEFGDYSFSNFVVGECNSFAFKAAVSVTDNLGGRNTNPMLIWGEPGQGKTHLLKAMASSICEKHPDKKAVYVTGEEFTNDFIACIKNKIYTDFREKYRKADCLLLDDIQFFKNKEGIQTELYNTVQTLLGAHRQIVLASEIAPGSLESIFNNGLENLFLSGLVINIQAPNFYTRRITE